MQRFLRPTEIILLLALLAFVLVPVWMRLVLSSAIYDRAADVPKAEVAIVLGASVAGGRPSPILAARADAAVDLYLRGKVEKILVTGDNGALSHDEVTPVRKYLLDAGVKPQDIFLDHAGFDTYSSMYRARAVFEASSVIIVTQDFHLPRALYIARSLGMQAYGFVATGDSATAYDYMREIPASGKAVLDVWLHRMPKYLGTPYPLTGDGQSTWY